MSRLLLSLVSAALVCATAFAKEDTPSFRTPQSEITSLNYEQLYHLTEKLEPAWAKLRGLIDRDPKDDISAGQRAILTLQEYEGVQENADLLIEVLRAENARLG